MKVVVLSTRFGSLGPWVRASNYTRLLQADFATTLVDISRNRNPGVKCADVLWRKMLRHTPSVWRFLYSHWQRIPGLDAIRRNAAAPFFRHSRAEVESLRPDLIISTNVHTTMLASWWKLHCDLKCQLVCALGAWHFQPSWCFPGVDHYLACTADQCRRLKDMGIPPEAITCAGFLVAPGFRKTWSRVDIRAQLSLPAERPVVLVMGGGDGWFLEEMTRAVAEARTQPYCVILCGSDQRAEAISRLVSALPSLEGRTRLLGYTASPEPYFAAADLLITKPGAMTIAEAFAIRTPVLALEPIAGHEEQGLAALRAHGAVAAANGNPTAAIDDLLSRPAELKCLSARGADMMSPASESIIPQAIHRLLA